LFCIIISVLFLYIKAYIKKPYFIFPPKGLFYLTKVARHYSFGHKCSADVNPLTPNDPYRGRTALLFSKRCILYIYSTDLGTEYFKHGLHSPFFFSSKCSLFHNSNVFGSCIIHILYTGCAKIKKKIIPTPKG
jgi:hypothetical protein